MSVAAVKPPKPPKDFKVDYVSEDLELHAKTEGDLLSFSCTLNKRATQGLDAVMQLAMPYLSQIMMEMNQPPPPAAQKPKRPTRK